MWASAAVVASLFWTALAAATELTFYTTDDTVISMRLHDENFGWRDHVNVRNRYGGGGSDYWRLDTLINFDLSSLRSDTEITLAELHLYYYDYDDTNPTGRALTCYGITSEWDEDTVTWDSRPSYASEYTSVSHVPSEVGLWMTWDVTEDVRAILSQPAVDNHGWAITDEAYWGHHDIPVPRFRSKEFGAFTPYLTVVPEPGTATLLLAGGLALIRRRRLW